MSQEQIQAFLNARVPSCAAGYTCLKDYRASSSNKTAVSGRCAGYAGLPNETAAAIIYKVAQSCGINPQVLLVTLQKEQSLVTSNAPGSSRYTIAMGYACPDTAACDANYYGFFNQVYSAAYQFKVYATAPSYFNHRYGQYNNVRFSPNSACGSSSVFIRNQATASLYNYTPYQPNAAALANLYGTGDGCSSYGNRNFFVFFTDWFGSTTGGAKDPVGFLDSLTGGPESINVRGWALDPDTIDPVNVHVYVDGVGVAILTASSSRPDVALQYPAHGANHGFVATVPVPSGTHEVCLYAINTGAGTNKTLSCSRVVVFSASPVGFTDSVVVVPGGVTLSGWALDAESADPIDVHVYVDGVGKRIVANENRPDVARQYPWLGANHGFSTTISLPSGTHAVCVYGINVGKGANALISCTSINVLAGAPFGALDEVKSAAGGVTVRGWAIDPDTADPITVHIYVDGVGYPVSAGQSRPDVARAYPVYGANHGYEAQFDAAPGRHSVCAYGINVANGTGNVLLGCRDVSVPSGDPFGAFDSASPLAGGIQLRGWAVDPDTIDPISVHVYVDGVGQAATLANVARPDVGRAYPSYGALHGFDVSVKSRPGNHNVCVYAINKAGYGTNPFFGCRTVSVG